MERVIFQPHRNPVGPILAWATVAWPRMHHSWSLGVSLANFKWWKPYKEGVVGGLGTLGITF